MPNFISQSQEANTKKSNAIRHFKIFRKGVKPVVLTSVPSPPRGPYVTPNPSPDLLDQRRNFALHTHLPDC